MVGNARIISKEADTEKPSPIDESLYESHEISR